MLGKRVDKTIFRPKRIGRPEVFAHHAVGFNKKGKSGRYLYEPGF